MDEDGRIEIENSVKFEGPRSPSRWDGKLRVRKVKSVK